MRSNVGVGIPRLQELDFLLVAHAAVARGETFESVRLALIDHMAAARAGDAGTGYNAIFQMARDKKFRYLSNAADSLKELMRLGFLASAPVPSEIKAAPYYAARTYQMTEAGEHWARLIDSDRAAAYDELAARLWDVHPQFAGYLSALQRAAIVVPLAQWTDINEPRTRERFLQHLLQQVEAGIAHEKAGWAAGHDAIAASIHDYISARLAFATARQRPQPYPRNQDFINACEEALVKLAFTSAGIPLDYISHEVLRRWMRTLGLANFSYYVPGSDALRLWSTADAARAENGLTIKRRIGEEFRERVITVLGESYDLVRRGDRTSASWVPIYRVRAAVCWRLRVSDAVFDKALRDFLAQDQGIDAPFGVNVDPAQYGSVPPSERGLQVETKRGPQMYYSMSLVPRRERVTR